MSIAVKWDNAEQTILRWEFIGNWDWDDFASAQDQSNALIESVPHVVHIISDVSGSRGLPPGALGQFRSYRRTDPANTGQILVVGANSFIQATVEMFRGLFPATGGQFEFSNSLEEARARLRELTTK